MLRNEISKSFTRDTQHRIFLASPSFGGMSLGSDVNDTGNILESPNDRLNVNIQHLSNLRRCEIFRE